MVALALPSFGDMRSPRPQKGRRRVMVSHRRLTDAPYRLDFSLDPDPDPDLDPFEHSCGHGLPAVSVGTFPAAPAASEELPAHHLTVVVVKIILRSSNSGEAMEKLLESPTELHGQVVLVEINNARRHISAEVLALRDQINTRFGFQGYELVVLIDDPDPPMLQRLARADVFIARTSSATKKFMSYIMVCRPEGPVAHLFACAPQKGSIIANTRVCCFRPTARVNPWYDQAIAMVPVLTADVKAKHVWEENHHKYVVGKHSLVVRCVSEEYFLKENWRCLRPYSVSEEYLEMGTYGNSAELFARHLEDVWQQLRLKATIQEMIRREKKRMKKMSKVIRLLKVIWSDPHNTKSFISAQRKDKPAIWLALHKLLVADHGYLISSRNKKATTWARKQSYLAQLVAACNSSASAGQSDAALLHPGRRPPIRFLLDSGASTHVVGDASLLQHLRHLPRAAARFATLPDGSRLPIIGVGNVQMDGFSIPNVYLVEGVTVNLVSVSRLATEHDICCFFCRNRCQLMLLADGRTGVVGEAVLDDDGVYGLRFLRVPEATA